MTLTHTITWLFRTLDYDEPAHGEWNPVTRSLMCSTCDALEGTLPEPPPPPDPDWEALHLLAWRLFEEVPHYPNRSRPEDPCPFHRLTHPHPVPPTTRGAPMITLEWNELECGCSMACFEGEWWLIAAARCRGHYDEARGLIGAPFPADNFDHIGPVRLTTRVSA